MPSAPCAIFALGGLLISPTALARQVPLNDLGVGTYNGFQGGLYPGGQNSPPAAHLASALAAASQITPLRNPVIPGSPAVIGVLSIGMSNTNQEWADFERRADATVHRNARVVIANGGVGGMAASDIDDPSAGYWTIVLQRLASLQLDTSQVQVVWLKEADQNPGPQFPQRSNELKNELRTIVQIIKDKFPNVRLCYLSSRGWSGYGSAEPYAYHTGFSVKWLIEDQINGDPALNPDPANGPAEAPLLLWGPYFWAQGATPRSDGLLWLPSDYEADHIHPGDAAEQKIGTMLFNFFSHDPTCQAWWPVQSGWKLVSMPVVADATVNAAAPASNFGADLALSCFGGSPIQATYLKFNLNGVARPAAFAKLGLRAATNPSSIPGANVQLVSDTFWNESTITFNSAPPVGATIAALASGSRDGTTCAQVTSTMNADADGLVSLRLSGSQAAATLHRSREAGDPARLILTIPFPLPGDLDQDGHVNTADLVGLLGIFGQSVVPNTFADLNGDGVVNTEDLVVLLGNFGA